MRLTNTRIVCPRGGCGIVSDAPMPPALDGVEIAVHHGLGILRRAEKVVPVAGLSMVGDEAIAVRHVGD